MTISATTQGIRPGVCLSTDRPVSPFTGQVIIETDTGALRYWNGSSWIGIGTTGKMIAMSIVFGG